MKIIVIGANAAGLSAAVAARKTNRAADITLITEESVATYSRCGLPFVLSGKISSFEKLDVYPVSTYRIMKLNLLTETRATRIDVDDHCVEAEFKDGTSKTLEYDGLVIATGAIPKKHTIEGSNKNGIFALHTIKDGIEISKAMKHSRSACVIGAGYIGLEIAESLIEKGIKTTIIESRPSVLPNIIDHDMSLTVKENLEKHGVDFIICNRADAVLGEESAEGVSVGGTVVEADLVITATGVEPNVSLAREAGISIGETGGIKTNIRMETSVKGVYAAGDCAETTNPITYGPTLPLLGATAVRQGKVAGVNVAGSYLTYPGALSSVVSQIFDFEVGATGLTESQARRCGLDVSTGKMRGFTRASYYPDAKPILVKVILEKESKHIIGGQIVGGEEVTQRINALSLAIEKNMCGYELVKADTCYAPSVCEASEPLVLAAEMAMRK
jgi:NADH oxidase (H2O2-forming)